jgi:hypothetical protein
MTRRANSGREALKTPAVRKFGVTLSVYPGMGIYVKRGRFWGHCTASLPHVSVTFSVVCGTFRAYANQDCVP